MFEWGLRLLNNKEKYIFMWFFYKCLVYCKVKGYDIIVIMVIFIVGRFVLFLWRLLWSCILWYLVFGYKGEN